MLTSGGAGVAAAWEAAPSGSGKKGHLELMCSGGVLAGGVGTVPVNYVRFSAAKVGAHGGAESTALVSNRMPSDYSSETLTELRHVSVDAGAARLRFFIFGAANGETATTGSVEIAAANYTMGGAATITTTDISALLASTVAGDSIGWQITREGGNAGDTVTDWYALTINVEY